MSTTLSTAVTLTPVYFAEVLTVVTIEELRAISFFYTYSINLFSSSWTYASFRFIRVGIFDEPAITDTTVTV